MGMVVRIDALCCKLQVLVPNYLYRYIRTWLGPPRCTHTLDSAREPQALVRGSIAPRSATISSPSKDSGTELARAQVRHLRGTRLLVGAGKRKRSGLSLASKLHRAPSNDRLFPCPDMGPLSFRFGSFDERLRPYPRVAVSVLSEHAAVLGAHLPRQSQWEDNPTEIRSRRRGTLSETGFVYNSDRQTHYAWRAYV